MAERLSYEEVEINLSKGAVINVQAGTKLEINGEVFVNGVLLEPTPPVVE
jgi:hypothetical protein